MNDEMIYEMDQKIAFITARIIGSLDFISAVHIHDPFHISFHHSLIIFILLFGAVVAVAVVVS